MRHSFVIAITTHCQAACQECPRTNAVTGNVVDWLPVEHMAYETFVSMIENSSIFKDGNSDIKFCGEYGDPMMHPQIEKFIAKALQHTRHLHIATNGGLRQPAWYKKMAETHGKRLHIDFAIDGVDADTNWKYRVGVDFNRAMENMITFQENEGLSTWHFIAFTWNMHQVPQVAEIASKHNIGVIWKINNRPYGLMNSKQRRETQEIMDQYDL